MSRPEPDWRVYPPPASDPGEGRCTGPVPAWLVDVRRFRGEMLYADGLRPIYRQLDGSFRDDDPCDPFAYHAIATLDGGLVATVRVVPLATTHSGVCERLFGTARLEQALINLGVDRAQTGEGSGWAVHSSWRGAAMGTRSLAACPALAYELGMRTVIGAVGIRYGALYRVLSAGYQRTTGFVPVEVPELADEVQLVHATLDDLRPSFVARVKQLTDLLKWPDYSPIRVNGMTSQMT